MKNLYSAAYECIMASIIDDKLTLTEKYANAWMAGELVNSNETELLQIITPGRPNQPVLVHPSKLPRRGMGTIQGRVILMHAIAHIEFNAINLAWDAVYRFRDMPDDYYSDWINVAKEEAIHFSLIQKYLIENGSDYGEYEAHDGLWHMAVKTMHDPLVRMALVPRVLEARGLDVTPDMIQRLMNHQDNEAAEILQRIYEDEIGHVQVGSRWFEYLCEERNIPAEDTFMSLLDEYSPEFANNQLNWDARLEAGFNQSELTKLENRK